jgi:hypothetical protein
MELVTDVRDKGVDQTMGNRCSGIIVGGRTRKVEIFGRFTFFSVSFEGEPHMKEHFVDFIVIKEGHISNQYDPFCTHVIIWKLLESDPIYCKARIAGMIVVTIYWIADCT